MMSNLQRFFKIENDPHLVRDRFSMGVINTNRSGLISAQRRKEEINTLRNELAELKALVLQIMEKK